MPRIRSLLLPDYLVRLRCMVHRCDPEKRTVDLWSGLQVFTLRTNTSTPVWSNICSRVSYLFVGYRQESAISLSRVRSVRHELVASHELLLVSTLTRYRGPHRFPCISQRKPPTTTNPPNAPSWLLFLQSTGKPIRATRPARHHEDLLLCCCGTCYHRRDGPDFHGRPHRAGTQSYLQQQCINDIAMAKRCRGSGPSCSIWSLVPP